MIKLKNIYVFSVNIIGYIYYSNMDADGVCTELEKSKKEIFRGIKKLVKQRNKVEK